MKKKLIVMSALALAFAVAACSDDDDNKNPECNTGSKTCTNTGKVRECVDGKWKESDCAEGKVCSGAGNCVTGDVDDSCDSVTFVSSCSGNILTSCNSNKKSTVDCTTLAGKVCGLQDNGKYGCVAVEKPDCQEGAKQCDNNGEIKISQVCQNGVWVSKDCQAGWTCSAGNCVNPNQCTEGAVRCNGLKVEKCEAGLDGEIDWSQKQQCNAETEKCSNGACVDKGSVPNVGDPCDRNTFTQVCAENAAYRCSSEGKVTELDCSKYSQTCVILANDTATCGYTNVGNVCDVDGDVFFFGNEYDENAFCDLYWDYGLVLYGACHLIDGVMYGVESVAESVCADDRFHLYCVSNMLGTVTMREHQCALGCSFDNSTLSSSCDIPAVGDTCSSSSFSPACKNDKTALICNASNRVAESACAGTEVCSLGSCVAASSIPTLGASCTASSFPDQCAGGMAYWCNGGKIAAEDCTANYGRCVMLEDGISWCAYPDADAYDQCTSDGEVLFYNAQWACMGYSEGAIIFDSCHKVDGTMHFIEDRIAASVCTGNNRRYCTSTTNLASTSCGSNTCSFDGESAVCK